MRAIRLSSGVVTTALAASEGFPPLDRQLGLSRHPYSRELILIALQLGAQIPTYRGGVQAFEMALKVSLGKSTLQRLSVECGSRVADADEQAAERLSAPDPGGDGVCPWQDQPEPDAETMAVSMDGVMVNTSEEGWKEVKLVAISAVESDPGEDEEDPRVRLTKHSYRAGLMDAQAFGKHQWAEACRRGLERAEQIVSVNDAAPWIWSLVRTCYAPCVEIIDWWHVVERLWVIGRTVLGEESHNLEVWTDRLKTLLWQGRMRRLFDVIRQHWSRGKEMPKDLRLAIGYLFRNRERMRYAQYRGQGYPIGSGTVESACKTVVQQRCCQSGMRWSKQGLRAILALRCTLLSGRWGDVSAVLTTAS